MKRWKKSKAQWYRLTSLVRWLLQAQTIDTLDSPHLVDLTNRVIYSNIPDNDILEEIERRREGFLTSHQILEVEDYGAGSSVYSSTDRTVREVARSAVSNIDKCRLLYQIVRYFKPSNILELGTSLGISSLYLAAAAPQAHITSIDADINTLNLAIQHTYDWADNIRYINATFEAGMDALLNADMTMDMIIVDGAHHSRLQQYLLPYYKSLSHAKTIWVIDDIYWSKDMTLWWHDLKSQSRRNVAIDLYHFGLLYHNDQILESLDIKILPKKIRWRLGLRRHLQHWVN